MKGQWKLQEGLKSKTSKVKKHGNLDCLARRVMVVGGGGIKPNQLLWGRVWILKLSYLSCHITVLLYVCYLPPGSTSDSCSHYNVTNHCSSRTRL